VKPLGLWDRREVSAAYRNFRAARIGHVSITSSPRRT
jgi:hypothetical protein